MGTERDTNARIAYLQKQETDMMRKITRARMVAENIQLNTKRRQEKQEMQWKMEQKDQELMQNKRRFFREVSETVTKRKLDSKQSLLHQKEEQYKEVRQKRDKDEA